MKRILPQSFIYPDIKEEQRQYGNVFLNNPIIRPDCDWRKSLTPEEEQRKNNVEPSSCFIEAQQHAIATIEEDQLGEIDNNYSARFNALKAGGTEVGGDPLAGADSIRHDGLVKEEVMPHDIELQSWDDFHSWKGVNQELVESLGKKDLETKERRFGVIVERDLPLKTKMYLIKEGLKRSPLPMSVWGVTDSNGNYIEKAQGVSDTHMVQATFIDEENRIHIRDTYQPFDKILPPNYDTDFVMGWTVKKKLNTASTSPWKSFIKWLISLFK